MDPLSAIGGIAASSQLLTETAKSVNAAYKLYRSFHNAPKELEQVAQKLDSARDRIKQIQAFGDDVSHTDMETLFPLQHRMLLSAALNQSMDAFGRLSSLADGIDRKSLRVRVSWAALDKKQVSRIMKDLSETDRILDQSLAIFNARLGTLHHTSLAALRVGQLAMSSTGSRIENSVANVEFASATTLTQIQENTAMVQSNGTLLQKSLNEQRENQQQMELMLAMQKQLMKEMHEMKTSMKLQHTSHGSQKDEPATISIEQQRPPSKELVGKTFKKPLASAVSRRYHQNGKTTLIEWGYGEYHLEAWTESVTQDVLQTKSHHRPPPSALAAKLRMKRKIKGKRTDIQARINLSILGSSIIQAELRIRVVARTWFSMPFVEAGFTTINVRPGDDPIFEAIDDMDFKRVKALLDCGEASIHDVSAGDGHTLLGMTLFLAPKFRELDYEEGRQRQAAAEQIFIHLLKEGCDPNIDAHTVREAPSLLAMSFMSSNSGITRLLYEHGADPDWTPVHTYVPMSTRPNTRTYLQMIDSWGLVDWADSSDDKAKSEFLHRICLLGDADLVIPHLEDGTLDVNETSWVDGPLHLAIRHGNIELATVFIAYGARLKSEYPVGDGKPETSALGYVLQHTTVLSGAHLLLFHGADVGDENGELFYDAFINYSTTKNMWFSYDELVGVAAHMLFHGASCHSWSLRQALLELVDTVEEPCQNPAFWTDRSVICFKDSDEYGMISPIELLGSENDEYERMINHDVFANVYHEKAGWKRSILTRDETDSKDSVSCSGKTGFEDLVSTRSGRRLLTLYPLATAYWAAVRMAGYCADVDDDGHVWWSDDDADPYFDAREEQPEAVEEDGFIHNCPMCQDPDAWGLRNMKDLEAAGLEAIASYRKQRATVNWPKTYR